MNLKILTSQINIYNDVQWKIVKSLKSLSLSSYTSLSSLIPLDYTKLKSLHQLIPLYDPCHSIMPTQYAYELLRTYHNNHKDIHPYISYYKSHPTLSITKWRQFIRASNSVYPNLKKDNIHIPNAELNKSLFFIKRQLTKMSDDEKKSVIKELNK